MIKLSKGGAKDTKGQFNISYEQVKTKVKKIQKSYHRLKLCKENEQN